jgi:hypothetical protein
MSVVDFTEQANSEWVTVKFRYDPELVSLVKQISPGLRRYDPDFKTWSVHESVAEQLVDAITAAGHSVGGSSAPAPEPIATPSLDAFFGVTEEFDPKAKAEEIIASLPGQHVGKVFRAMGRLLYPEMWNPKA